MKKIHCQLGPSTSGPPISHAAVAPMPPSAPQIPSALFRSAPSGKVVEMIDSAVGVMISGTDAPDDGPQRSAAGDQASLHMSDAARKARTLAMKIGDHAWSRSAACPPSRSRPPKVRA